MKRIVQAIAAGVAIVAILLAVAALLTGCDPNNGTTNNGQPQGRVCDDSCTNDPDTVTVSVIWLAPQQVPKNTQPLGEVTWTVAGVVQYTGQHALDSGGSQYKAWYHSWKANKYPRISVTADENVHGGVYCQLQYADAKGNVTVIDYSQRGPLADPGSVTCSTDLWVNDHFNKGE